MQTLLASLHTPSINIGGITLYRIAPQTLAPYRHMTAREMQRRAARTRFEALLLGAQRHLAEGDNTASLNPESAQQLGLLPQDWFSGPLLTVGDPFFHSRIGLGPSKSNGIAVGAEGRYNALESIIQLYGADASRIYFPYQVLFSPLRCRLGRR